MKLFNPKETPELERLKQENEELRNTIHQVLNKQNSSTELEQKISEQTTKLSELAKEEERIQDFLKNSTDEKVIKSKSIFELNKQISELAQKKEQLEANIKTIENKNESLLKKHKSNESKLI